MAFGGPWRNRWLLQNSRLPCLPRQQQIVQNLYMANMDETNKGSVVPEVLASFSIII